ncbi:MAG TPA: FHA domain-containing protein [Polyangiaceae bacterium]|nr:FHA domain-containing protein [Polyangiaceae bacterium]
MWLLSIEDDEGLTTFHRLTRDRYTIGRAPGADFVLAQLDVSRRHARLERDEGGLWLVDEGSRGGTFVNAMPVRGRARVGDGAVAQIGGYVLRFSGAVPTGVPTPPPRYVAPARLRAIAGPLAGQELVFPRDETVTIGRSDDCTLRVLDDRVSVVHALFLPLPDGRHELVDMSHNGLLFVNGRPLSRRVLEGGDAINVGGVALFRYLEPRQQPDPRFDAVWAKGAALACEPVPDSAPAPRAARPSRPAASGRALGTRAAPEGDGASNEARVEAVGPRALPAQAAPSASFERLCRATMGRGDAEGGERAFVVEPAGPPASDAALRWYAGSPGAHHGVASVREGGAGSRADAGARGPQGAAGEAESAAAEGPPEGRDRPGEPDRVADEGTPQADVTPARSRRQWSALLFPVVAAAAVGATVGLQAPLPGLSGAGPLAAAVEVAGAPPPSDAEVPAAATGEAGPEPYVVASAPPLTATPLAKAMAEPAPNEGALASRGGGRRARLAARMRSGRASADELRELISLCHLVGDVRCVAEARTLLPSARRGP